MTTKGRGTGARPTTSRAMPGATKSGRIRVGKGGVVKGAKAKSGAAESTKVKLTKGKKGGAKVKFPKERAEMLRAVVKQKRSRGDLSKFGPAPEPRPFDLQVIENPLAAVFGPREYTAA